MIIKPRCTKLFQMQKFSQIYTSPKIGEDFDSLLFRAFSHFENNKQFVLEDIKIFNINLNEECIKSA